ncbi:hypothetical protein [Deinococcus hopiensis]|uniref:hypothetical protein n=1 Tax=Deinococcus hopiensis TaxID=309885 RepID=UPI00111BD66C|nr:hypothetical protein [Deinococcus hopiensis]
MGLTQMSVFQVQDRTLEVQKPLFDLCALVMFRKRLGAVRFIAHDEPGVFPAKWQDRGDTHGSITLRCDVDVVLHGQATMLTSLLAEPSKAMPSSIKEVHLPFAANVPVPAVGREIGHQRLVEKSSVCMDAGRLPTAIKCV